MDFRWSRGGYKNREGREKQGEETESRKEMERLERMKAAERWNLEEDLKCIGEGLEREVAV